MTGTLEAALRIAGVPCVVEVRDRLAIIRPDALSDAGGGVAIRERRRIIALAQEHGFSHVALELDMLDGATLPGRQS